MYKIATFLLFLITCSFSANGAVIFEDDFSSYADGSNLAGQGGWSTVTGAGVIINNSTSILGGAVADGFDTSIGFDRHVIENNVGDLSSQGLVELSYVAYGRPSGPSTSNSRVQLAISGESKHYLGWHFSSTTVPKLNFRTRTGLASTIIDHEVIEDVTLFNRAIQLSLILDTTTSEAFGTIVDATSGSELYRTSTYSIDASLVSSLDSVQIANEYAAGVSGAEYANISVTNAIPEPTSMSLLGLGALSLLYGRRKKRA